LSAAQDVLTIDPVAMNVVNRIAAGCRLSGEHVYEGGLLIQGDLEGSTRVNGTLIVWHGACLRGRVRVHGDFYLFGQLGASDAGAQDTVLECLGTAYVASTGVSSGTLLAQRLQLYDGADLQGPFKTLKRHDMLPVLSDIHDGSAPA
jgi:cytoskeletal protein CcmA (bactofilin family)